MTYYVYSGSLKGIRVEAAFPAEAVERAVLKQIDQTEGCLLGSAIRVSQQKEDDPSDVFFVAPYEEQFPTLFTGDLDIQEIPVEKI